MSALQQYIKENMFCRCGQVVSRLAANNLIPRYEMFPSESEVQEWWLVSQDLAEKLCAADLPVVRFGELYMWGRSAVGIPLEYDMELICAIDMQSFGPRRGPAEPK